MNKDRMPSSFHWLNAAQFLGALNDNVFKLFAIFFLIGLAGGEASDRITGFVGLLFPLPFILFSSAAGVWADRYSKRDITVYAKYLEVAVMLFGAAGFALRSPAFIYAALFLMAAQSALFGPAKYGILPELVGKERLPRANGLLVMSTYIAIILGTALAPALAGLLGGNYPAAQFFCVLVAALGTAASLPIRRTPPAGSRARVSPLFAREIWRTLWSIRSDRFLLLAVIGSAYFSVIGAFMQLNVIPYGIVHMGIRQEQSGYIILLGAIGIAAGALVSSRISSRNIEFGIVPLGALALTVAALGLYLVPPVFAWVCPTIFLAGFGAGLFIVPIDSFIQFQAPRARLGEVLAASSFLGWVGVLMAGGFIALNASLGISPAAGFAFIGLLTLALTVAALLVLPDFLLRFIALVVTRTAYRIRISGADRIPLEGPALLVCNHASYMDALLLLATQQRRIRFIMNREIYDRRAWLKPLLNLMGIIPIAENDGPKRLVASLREARKALDEGYLVCIFAEGALTRTGMMLPFRRGFERILKGTAHPIIPVCLEGAWGSIYSYYHGQLVTRWPGLRRYPVWVLFGAPLPPGSSASEVRLAVMELSCDAFNARKPGRRPMIEEFIRSARRNWNRQAISDTSGKSLTHGQTLVAALALARLLRPRLERQKNVGILLPASAGAALANLAISLLGRTPVNLNYTAAPDSLASAVRQAGLRTVLTSRAFLDRLPGQLRVPGPAFMEDMLPGMTPGARLRAWLSARFVPARALASAPRLFTADAPAAILFSSGSTAEPKGIVLSHHNLLSNMESLRMVFNSTPGDNICAALPFFHSLGFTAALWFPLLNGLSAAYHANPLDGATIAKIVRTRKSRLLFATPSFLSIYLRKAAREDFASLRLVVTGAEKLSQRLADAFEERFGVRPLEGYGATELSPVATLSVPHAEVGGMFQAGWKQGSVGLPLPGVAVRVADAETGAPLPDGQPGLLLVKGPNVMLGYLDRPDLTEDAIRGGWYCTGDIASIDEDGFVTIQDRLSRFSKIAGEMVPHAAVEEAFAAGADSAAPTLAVTSVPDEVRGERIVVLHTAAAGGAAKLRAAIAQSKLPNLWKPDSDAYLEVEALPLTGSGKLDLRGLRELAKQRFCATGRQSDHPGGVSADCRKEHERRATCSQNPSKDF